MKICKRFASVAAIITLAVASCKIYDVYFQHRFSTVSEKKVYKSGTIPPNQIASFVKEYGIKSIIDLRGPLNTKDLINNPEKRAQITAEKKAVADIDGVNYFNIPSEQVPNDENLKKFFAVLDNKDNYPVLIHCYHGIGRAELYSQLYRIEYEGWSNQEAQDNAACPPVFSSFADGTLKGDYLTHYIHRSKTSKY